MLGYVSDALGGAAQYSIIDHQRGRQILFMLAVCFAVIVAFGRWRGFTAIIGLGVSFAFLLASLFPASSTASRRCW